MSGHPELLMSLVEQFYIQLAGEAFIVKYVNLSTVAFLVYHSLLNIDDELKYIWESKWGFSKCIYIATKYLAFCDGLVSLVYMFNTSLRPSSCSILFGVIIYFMAIGIVIAETVLLIRTWVAWGLSRYVFWYLTLAVVVATSVGIFIIQAHSEGASPWPTHVPSAIPTITNCVNEGPAGIKEQYLSFVCIIVFELNVLLLTLWNLKINSIWWHNRDKNPVIYAFHRDSLAYLGFLLSISFVNVVFFKFKQDTLYAHMFMEPQRIAHGVFSAQLILNARKYAETTLVGTSNEWGWFHPTETRTLSFQAMEGSGTEEGEAIELQEIS